ncbi:B3/4 domain-containing protein [Ornithinimicrobium flavum]|uniref:B3/B4 domain-containing protein n=1 Tax=Ornithinimicrobium flavum TaxID=1288636 RepID=UPI00106F1B4F|nr:phenylalanine--tRNA ligase beta subunit-related protein [Ornithinimicrobium flavum]
MPTLDDVLAAATINPAVVELAPDYRVLLLAVSGITPGPSDARSEEALIAAEDAARAAMGEGKVEDLPKVASWRAAYRAFGAKPQRTRHSLEALLRRVDGGLPRVNRLTDLYNAVSVRHQIPLGGEDLDRYVGPPRLVRATGEEAFETTASGGPVVEHPEVGEVVWRDDAGVTCRRWNWRQTTRTALTEETTTALFILDALDPLTNVELEAAADELVEHLRALGPELTVARRLVTAG